MAEVTMAAATTAEVTTAAAVAAPTSSTGLINGKSKMKSRSTSTWLKESIWLYNVHRLTAGIKAVTDARWDLQLLW